MSKALQIPPRCVVLACESLEALCDAAESADTVLARYAVAGLCDAPGPGDFALNVQDAARLLEVRRGSVYDRLHSSSDPLPRNENGTFSRLDLLLWDARRMRRKEEVEGVWGNGQRLSQASYHDSRTALRDGAVFHCAIAILLHAKSQQKGGRK